VVVVVAVICGGGHDCNQVRGVMAMGYGGGGGRRDPVVAAVVVVDVREWWWWQNELAAWVTDVCCCGSTSCPDVVVVPLTAWWRWCHRRVAGCTEVVAVVVDAVGPLAHGSTSGGCRGCRHREGGGGTAFHTVALPVAWQS